MASNNPFLDAVSVGSKPKSDSAPASDNPFLSAISVKQATSKPVAPRVSPVTPPAPPKQSLFQKVGSVAESAAKFVGSETMFAVEHPVTATKTVAKALVSNETNFANDLAAGISANYIMKTNAEIEKEKQSMNQTLLARYKNETDPAKKAKTKKILLDNIARGTSGPGYTDVFSAVPALSKTPAQVIADGAGVALDLVLGSSGFSKAGKAFVLADAGKSVIINAVKEPLLKAFVSTAAIGATYGGLQAVQAGQTSVKSIAEQAAIGAVTGAGLGLVGHVVVKAVGGVTKVLQTALKSTLRDYAISDFDKKFASEIAANVDKSPTVSSTLQEVFQHHGEDMQKLEKNGVLGNKEAEAFHAGTMVEQRMSPEVKKEIMPEVDKAISEGDPSNARIAKAVAGILDNPGSREHLPKLSRYMDSVLGIVNPAVKDVSKELDALPAKMDAGETAKLSNLKLNVQIQEGVRPSQKFNAETGQSTLTFPKGTTEATKWHEIAHAIDRQNPGVREVIASEVKSIVGMTDYNNITNENLGDAFKAVASDPSLREKYPKIAALMNSVPQEVLDKIQAKETPLVLPGSSEKVTTATPALNEAALRQKAVKQLMSQGLSEKIATEQTNKLSAEELAKAYGDQPISAKSQPSVATKEGFTIGKYYEGTDKYSRNINPQKINSVQDVSELNDALATKYEKLFQDVKGGTKPNEVTAKEAEQLGWTIEDIKKIPQRALLNSAQTAAVAQVKADLTLKLAETAQSIGKNPTEAEKKTLNDLVAKILYADSVNKVSETELGRAIQAKQIIPIPAEYDESIMAKLEAWGVTGAKDVNTALTASEKITKTATKGDVFWSLYYNSILSGPSTHARIIVHSALGTLVQQIENVVRNPKNVGRQVQALAEGWLEAKKSFVDIVVGKKEIPGKPLFDYSETLTPSGSFQAIKKPLYTVTKKLLNVAQYVGRTISAEHSLFKEVAYKGNLSDLTFESLKKETKGQNLSKEAFDALYKERFNNPPKEIVDQAVQESLKATFNTERPEGAVGVIAEAVGRIANIDVSGKNLALGIKPFKFVVPFTRIAANILNRGLDFTPVGFLRTAGTFLNREADQFATRKATTQLGEAVLGSVGMVYVANLAANGIITGAGPSNKNLRLELESQGWKPNSIKIGDTYYPYAAWGSYLTIPISIAANWAEAVKYGQLDNKNLAQKASYAILGAANSILDVSFLSNLKTLSNALRDPTSGAAYLQTFSAGAVTSMYPNILRQIGSMFQDENKQVNSYSDMIKSDLGYPFNKSLQPKLDTFGEPIPTQAATGTITQRFAKGVAKAFGVTMSANNEKEMKPLVDFLTSYNVGLTVPANTTTILYSSQDKPQRMNSSELYEYQKIYGQNLKQNLLDDQDYLTSLDNRDDVRAEITKVQTQTTKQSKDDFLSQFDK